MAAISGIYQDLIVCNHFNLSSTDCSFNNFIHEVLFLTIFITDYYDFNYGNFYKQKTPS